MNKTLILVRHAHRDKDQGGDADNGLSEKGREQAKRLKRYFERAYPHAKALVVSSPKKRCQETVAALAKSGKSRLKISPLLDEGEPLVKKVKDFIKWWREQAPSITVACSHGDWIPVGIDALTGKYVELRKGGFAVITLNGNGDGKEPKLEEVVQSLD